MCCSSTAVCLVYVQFGVVAAATDICNWWLYKLLAIKYQSGKMFEIGIIVLLLLALSRYFGGEMTKIRM